MAFSITVPRLGWSMEEGTFVQWLKREGDFVRVGDPLFSLESEKSVEEVPAIDAGILRFLPNGPREGDTVAVGALLGYLTAEGEALPVPVAKSDPSAIIRQAATGVSATVQRTQPTARSHRITPRARRAARRLNVEVATLTGTGRNGRIRERDVLAAAKSSGGTLQPITPIRRAIASRMSAGVHEAAPVTLTTRCDASKLVAFREQAKRLTPDSVPGFTEILVKLSAVVLRDHPGLMVQWRDDGLFLPDAVHIAVAVDTDAGLLAPVIRDVDSHPLSQIVSDLRSLAEAARAGRLTSEQMAGGVFTVTNLGRYGIDAFTPILNLPQTSILGVGCVREEVVVEAGQFVARPMLTLSLTFDHRAIDGAPAARFLESLCGRIEGWPHHDGVVV